MSHSQPIQLSLPEVFTALSYALDITEGQPRGHSVRCCWIGIHIGKELSLNKEELWELYYTLLLKDAGCSSNAARLFQLYGTDDRQTKKNFKHVDSHKLLQVVNFIMANTSLSEGRLAQIKRIIYFIQHGKQLTTELIQTRCERGANITRRLGFSEQVARGVMHLDEHYNGEGRPQGLKGQDIPLYARIALLAQVADVFHQIGGSKEALREVHSRSGTWFDPQLVQAITKVAQEEQFWDILKNELVEQAIAALEPKDMTITVNEEYLDTIAQAFADIIDAKSPFTFGHSRRVAAYSDIMAEHLGIDQDRRRWFHRGALLHDIGKLGVSNAVLDKPGKLTDDEYAQIKEHARYTEEILSKISIFKELAQIAAAHHERLDGKGYHKGLKGESICLLTRILTVADIFDALSAKRPYRDAMPLEKVFSILEEMRGTAVDGRCVDALKARMPEVLAVMQQEKRKV